MKNLTLLPVIGMEVHVELATQSKMFCGCPAFHFSKKPNTQTCPVCLGLPGALPVPNKRAVKWTQLIGLALNCKPAGISKFDRKHYFYPDLPKGFQISQYDQPLSVGGYMDAPFGRIRVTRVHLEEDTGKLKHAKVKGKNVTLVDFNRSGVPLVEIVTEPDIHSAKQAVEFTKNLRRIIRYLGISDCDMEKGSMRLEANVSVGKIQNLSEPEGSTSRRPKSKFQKLPDYKVELKNINSFRFLEKAIDLEVKRQSVIILSGGTPVQETRGYDENKNETFSQRTKEKAQDYRYFPEPDIPPMYFTKRYIDKLKKSLPELPDKKAEKFRSKFKLPEQYIGILIDDKEHAEATEELLKKAVSEKVDPKEIAGLIVNKGIDPRKFDSAKMFRQIKAQSVKVTDMSQVKKWINQAIKENPKAASDYRGGQLNAVAVIIGTVMRLSGGKADPKTVRKIAEGILK